ncbi:hypothetical protein CHS0354_029195, partial [Potamilus streckersoni]
MARDTKTMKELTEASSATIIHLQAWMTEVKKEFEKVLAHLPLEEPTKPKDTIIKERAR